MTNREKWQQKLAEAKDGSELLETINKMNAAHTRWCWEYTIRPCVYGDCGECKAKWLDRETEMSH